MSVESEAEVRALAAIRRELARDLPKGWALRELQLEGASARRMDTSGGLAGDRGYYVTDSQDRRRTFTYGPDFLEGLLDELRKLAVEVRRIDYWRRKPGYSSTDVDRLAADLCPYLAKSKGKRWGYAPLAMKTPCCETEVPAGTFWFHDDAPNPAVPGAGGCRDVLFDSPTEFGRFLLDYKENRFGR